MVLDATRLEGLVHAPEFPSPLEWLNCARPLTLQELKGKVVLLDFWTFCCINCMHIIPDLKKLEAKYSEDLVVIGVHSAKFTHEKKGEAIRQAVIRYGIPHPIVNDLDFKIWQDYAVSAWPTLVLINPNGKVVGIHSGEGVYEVFDPILEQTIRYFRDKGELCKQHLPIALEEEKMPQSLLSFPGKISSDRREKRLFISDTRHHRILVVDPKGKILDVIGSGHQGQSDGSFEECELNGPQGTAIYGNVLYIADTENHLIRSANLKTRKLTTLWGTGSQSRRIYPSLKGMKDLALNSPWDLSIDGGQMFIAMAGSHQIWRGDLETLDLEIYAGSGQESRIDGPRLSAALAQPSGIASDGEKLFIADSEVSSVRSVSVAEEGRVETLVGEDLFDFGDQDGNLSQAKLQHPLGLAFAQGELFIADSYNSKIKRLHLQDQTLETYAGTGNDGDRDGNRLQAEFYEPGGLTILQQKLYVADTNNHRIRVIDLETAQVSTLMLSGLEPVSRQSIKTFHGKNMVFPETKMKKGDGVIELCVDLPEGLKLAENAPFYFKWKAEDVSVAEMPSESRAVETTQWISPIRFPVKTNKGFTKLILEAVVYYCRKNSTLCLFENYNVEIPLRVMGSEAPSKVTIHLPIAPKKIN